jgi:hypothetical protein
MALPQQFGFAILLMCGIQTAAMAQTYPGASIRAGNSVLYKCVARDSTIVYQDQACEPADQWTGRTEYPNSVSRDGHREYAPNNDGQQRVIYNAPIPVLVSDASEVRRARCSDSKARREAVLRDIGLDRTFDLLRQLDEMVSEACRAL